MCAPAIIHTACFGCHEPVTVNANRLTETTWTGQGILTGTVVVNGALVTWNCPRCGRLDTAPIDPALRTGPHTPVDPWLAAEIHLGRSA